MPSPIYISRPPSGFSMLAVLRGLQLTVLGAIRALRNPYLVESGYYKKSARAILISLAIQIVLWLPIWLLRFIIWMLMLVSSPDAIANFQQIVDTLEFIENNVLNIGLFLVSAVRFFQPEMDEMFLFSLEFVDKVYKKKHPESHREFYGSLSHTHKHHEERKHHGHNYPKPTDIAGWLDFFSNFLTKDSGFVQFVKRYLKHSALSLVIFLLSGVPVLGRIILPVTSFYSLNKVVGTPTALVLFAVGLAVERKYMIIFLSTFWGGRRLVRELLAPFFSRVPLDRENRDLWFKAREGIMFGFGCGFYWFLKVPFFGVLVYGIAEASSAYLISKVSEPLPPPHSSTHEMEQWVKHEIEWTTKEKFLSGYTLDHDGFGVTPGIPGAFTHQTALEEKK
ncbi:hypothetical protein D0Z00_001638 [Geotrichum galactomycetum]|uniref:Uncharacterized protein n=1 Tax=Geotrichum galactomycetum TaxID=27317 RepID=A0ACB6V6F0_9ASCO|nr:hypothetical protein D0Z00_001638 [Geotrichum candidum]